VASASAAAVEILGPDGASIAHTKLHSSFFDYPADGSLVHIGSIRINGRSETLTDISLLSGEVTAIQTTTQLGARHRVTIAGLSVHGVARRPQVNALYRLSDGSYLIAHQEAIAAGATGLIALRLHLAQSRGPVPAGSEILLGVPVPRTPQRRPGLLGLLGLPAIVIGGTPPTGGYVYPLAARGTVIGCPFVPGSTHSPFIPPDNLASDDAIDIAVATGTPVLAVAAGTIGTLIGPLDSADPRLAGLRVHLNTPIQRFYYAHLSRIDVRPGQHVRPGQQLGLSGSAAGVAHLHFAQDGGNPAATIGDPGACPFFIQYYEPWG
jgi:hypothetical protein